MSDLAPRPRSAPEIIDAGIQLFRRGPVPLIIGAAIASVPQALLLPFLSGAPTTFRTDPTAHLLRIHGIAALQQQAIKFPVAAGMNIRMILLISIITIPLTLLGFSTMVVLASDLYLTGQCDLGAAFRRALRRWGAMIGAWIASSIGTLFFFCLLFLPAIWFAIRCFALIPVIVVEDAGISKAFSRSAFLSSGLKWHIFWTFVILMLMYLVVSAGASLLFGALGVVLHVPAIAQALMIITRMLVLPVLATGFVVLYYDTRIRREGYDIELMATMPGMLPNAVPA